MHGYIGYSLNRTQITQLYDFIFGSDLPRGVKKHLDSGFKYKGKNLVRKAIEEFDKGIKDDYKNVSYEIRFAKAEILNNLKESHDEAIRLCNEAIRIVDKTPVFHYIQARGLIWINKGNAHYFKKEYDLALKCYKTATRFMPDYPNAWGNLGACLIETEDYDEALECIEMTIFLREIKERQQFAVDFEFKGKALLNLGRLKEAYSCFQKVLNLDPANKTAKEKISLLEKELS